MDKETAKRLQELHYVDPDKPIHKFNGGRGATLCHKCSVIITEGFYNILLCKKCENDKND